jgi:hypothetical protein
VEDISEELKQCAELMENSANKILDAYQTVRTDNERKNETIHELVSVIHKQSITIRWVVLSIIIPLSIVAALFSYYYFTGSYQYGNVSQNQDGTSSSQVQTIGGN